MFLWLGLLTCNNREIALSVLKSILPERLPTQTQLLANYPNPFHPETWIPFQLAQELSLLQSMM